MNNIIKLAIQKKGRLTDETIRFLKNAGFEFESSNRRLYSFCDNFPLEIVYLRDDDIGNYVEKEIIDLGIVGQNLLYERNNRVKKLLNLRYGFCSLVLAVPKESRIKELKELNGLKVATSYPVSAASYFKKNTVDLTIVKISGSVESAPSLGVSDAVVDLMSTGSTLALNDLKIFQTIYESEAVLISNQKAFDNPRKKQLIEKVLRRLMGVLSAKSYKYVLMNVPENIIPKLIKIIPGLKSPTLSPLAQKGWLSIQSVIKEDVFWETVEHLTKLGVRDIIVLPIEKVIN